MLFDTEHREKKEIKARRLGPNRVHEGLSSVYRGVHCGDKRGRIDRLEQESRGTIGPAPLPYAGFVVGRDDNGRDSNT